MTCRVQKISSKAELEKAFRIRFRVFVHEQGVPGEIEIDEADHDAVHFLACVGEKAVGTARVVITDEGGKIGRMAVLKRFRHKGVGKKLLDRAVAAARKSGAQEIYLHAQVPVIPFYESSGFKAIGRIFDEAGIPHRKMILSERS
jgi:predicted GNAT family N-acyltransferase